MSAKQSVYRALHRSGLWRVFGRKTLGAIFMLHRVVQRHEDDGFQPNRQFAITEDVLRTIVDTLEDARVEVVSLDEACARLAGGPASGGDRNARRFACLTFDDGYRDNFELALPLLAARGMPMATYVTSGLVDATDPAWWFALEDCLRAHASIEVTIGERTHSIEAKTAPEKTAAFEQLARALQLAPRDARLAALDDMRARYGVDAFARTRELVMDWTELRAFAAHDLVTIGAHTVSHAALASLSAQSMQREIEESRRRIEAELEIAVDHFAFPYGDVTTKGAREFDACRELGFKSATTTRHDLLRASDKESMHCLPRVPTDPFDSAATISVKLSGIPALLQSLRTSRRRAS